MCYLPSGSDARETALALAATGRAEAVPALKTLLEHPDFYVCSAVGIGICRAVDAGVAEPAFKEAMFPLVLAQCDRRWTGNINNIAEALFALDPCRATESFSSSHWLSKAHPNSREIIGACNHAGCTLPPQPLVALAAECLRSLPDQSFEAATLAANTLTALARVADPATRSLAMRALGSPEHRLQEAAAEALATLAGSHEPIGMVLDAAETVDPALLPRPHLLVYCVYVFHSQTCRNGAQSWYDGYGHLTRTLSHALRELDQPEAATALDSATAQLGPHVTDASWDVRWDALAAHPERDRILTELEHVIWHLPFSPTASASLFAVSHNAAFPPRRPMRAS